MTNATIQSPFLPNTQAYNYTETVHYASLQPLHNCKLAVKDLFHMHGLPTTAGNPDWANTHTAPLETNHAVLKLMQAGARFVGKTITDELAYSLNGQNIHYGTPTNPVTPERLPGGSSSGSAVAVSAGLADIGLGTDTGGSIRVPASYNGLFGLRPSHGLIACDNMVALAPSFDTVGFMTANLETLQLVAQVLLPQQTSTVASNTRLGVATNLVNSAAHKVLIHNFLAKLTEPGYESSEAKSFTVQSCELNIEQLQTSETFRILQGAEIWQTHGEWISTVKPNIAADIQARFDWCKTLSAKQVNIAKSAQQHIIDYMAQQLANVDAIILPTTPGKAPLLNEPPANLNQYRSQLLSLTAIAGLCGLPQLHLPLFELEGAPCGISLIGKKGSDTQLMNIAQQLLELNYD